MEKRPQNSLEFRRWLHPANPDEWHQVVQSWNWDNGTGVLNWVVDQADCDVGTALHIFWGSEPFWNLSRLDPYRETRGFRGTIDGETLTMQINILAKWVRNQFTRFEIAFGGHVIQDYQRAQFVPLVPIEVLEDMARPRTGKKVELGQYDEGVPFDIAIAWNKANGFLQQ